MNSQNPIRGGISFCRVCFPCGHDRKDRCGQAMIELSLIFFVLGLVVFGVIEYSRALSLSNRLASVAREAARQYIALDLEPTDPPGAVYARLVDMVAPADMERRGKVIFSILKRFDPLDNTDYADRATQEDDYVRIVAQWTFPASANVGDRASWQSKIPTVSFDPDGAGSGFAAVDQVVATQDFKNYISLDMLRVEETTVAVEIFHATDPVTPIGAFINFTDVLYETAVY